MSTAAVKMLAGDREAYGEVYREFHPRVAGLCHNLLGSPDEAQDASSEVFARLPVALKTYDSAMPFSRWLSSVASHYCVDLLRKRRSEQRVIQPAGPETPEPAARVASPLQALLLEEARTAVRAAVADLPERYRLPLALRYYHELSYDEIAQRLELSRSNVATLIFRAKDELRRVLKKKSCNFSL